MENRTIAAKFFFTKKTFFIEDSPNELVTCFYKIRFYMIKDQVLEMVKVALMCLQFDPHCRPTMISISTH